MFDAKLTGSGLNSILDPVQAIVEETKLHLDEEELSTTAVDPANVAMVRFVLNETGFDEYDADGELVGVNLNRMADVAGMADSADEVSLTVDDDAEKLSMTIGRQLEANISLISPGSIRDEPDIPDMDYPAELTMTGADLNRAVKAADMVSDHLIFRVDSDSETFYVEAAGDTDDVSLELDGDDLVDIDAGGDAHSLFALDYLKDMNKAIPKDAEVTVEVGEEVPVQMHFELMDGDAEITYLLAPRIETE